MKVVTKLVVLLGVGALLPFATFAKSAEQAYVEASSKKSGVPVPLSVVSPRNIGSEYAGSTVELAFTVDQKGTPTGLQVLSSPDETIARTVVGAVEKWRFAPATKDGSAVTSKVILPVHIIDSGARIAAN